MLIGGPNQSHKVNFKELLPMRERCPRHGLSFAPSILFLKNLSGKYREITVAFAEASFARPALQAQGAERREEKNARSQTGHKSFLKNFAQALS
jgi:hypothetical protein